MSGRRLSEPCRARVLCRQVGLRRPLGFATNGPVFPGSTDSSYGFLFSVAWDMEGFRQMQSRFVERQMMHGGP
jgi:hypothetical protein